MSMDILQEKIRKLKNPTVIDMTVTDNQIPLQISANAFSVLEAKKLYICTLMDALRETVPAVRFSFNTFAIDGAAGLCVLDELLCAAKQNGYYVFLDAPDALTQSQAEICANAMLNEQSNWQFDSLLIGAYLGSNAIAPYAKKLDQQGKSLFALIRSANKSAAEIQDLLSGSRLVHMAAAEMITRFEKPSLTARNGYSNIGVIAAATAPESLRSLRERYKSTFLFVDGYDQPAANAKNCSAAFDKLGHGAVVCAGSGVTAAWLKYNNDGDDYIRLALDAAERMKKNLLRYISIL